MNLSSFNRKFYLVYYDEKLQLIDSMDQLREKYKEHLKKEKEKEKEIVNKRNNENNSVDYSNDINNLNNNINNNSNDNNSMNNNSFLIVSEFIHIPPSTFKINGPILSYELRKEIKDVSLLCRSWRLCKKNEENLLSIGDVIKLGRARLKIDTICLGEIYESCQINNNLLKNKPKKKRY